MVNHFQEHFNTLALNFQWEIYWTTHRNAWELSYNSARELQGHISEPLAFLSSDMPNRHPKIVVQLTKYFYQIY